MKKKITILFTALAMVALGSFAQGRKSLRINEVMVDNQSSLVDEYGQHSAWIELFNSNFAPLQISSVYLTNDPAQPKKYPVPLGDEVTKMGKRQTIVFFADGDATKGTLHTSFALTPGQDNWVGIYDADGITLIDSITIPAALATDNSYARATDGKGDWQVRNGQGDRYITPGSANVIKGVNPKIDEFAQKDSHGFAMTLMAMGVVFCALLILCLAFYGIGAISKYVSRLNKARSKGVTVDEVPITDHDSGEEIAAVVMALHEHLNAHDDESTILTIRKMKRAYSPWSSKIYSLRQLPHR
jgi:Na+-transporting methylmalonyl-CoA/oxaloacetate decarboxylase gamma subunit